MNGEPIWILLLLVVATVLFATGRVHMDTVALFVVIAFALSGTLTVPKVFSGFPDSNVVPIAALFIISDGLVRIGVTAVVGTWLIKVTDNSEVKMSALLTLTVAGPGMFMSSTGVIAILIPVVLSVVTCVQTSPSRLMMSLSFAGLTSGMMTLVTTPPNLVVSSELLRKGYHDFSFFSVIPIDLVMLVLGILYMLVMRSMLEGDIQALQREGWTRRTFRDLIREYRLTGRAQCPATRPGSSIIGQRLDDFKLRKCYGASVIGIERQRRFRRVIANVDGVFEPRARGVLLIDMSAVGVDLRQFCSEQLLESMVLRDEYFSGQVLNVGMAEISLIPESGLIGKLMHEVGFRTHCGSSVIGLKHNGAALKDSLADEPLLPNDIILVADDWKLTGVLTKRGRDSIALNLSEEVSEASSAHSQAPHATFYLVLMMTLMLIDEIPNPVAAIIAYLLTGKFHHIDAENVYKSIHWPSIILIVGMIPFAVALQKTGGVTLAVKGLMDTGGGYGSRMILGCLLVLSAVIGLFISNTVTAVLMVPIALTAARATGVPPYPFTIIVTMVTPAASITPVSSLVNTLVLGPENYSSSNFMKLGIPFVIAVMAVCAVITLVLFPF